MITIPQLADAAAHTIAASIAQAGLQAPQKPITGIATLSAGVKVIVTICADDGPATISQETLQRIDAMRESATSSKCPISLTPLQKQVAELMTGQTTGRKAAWIAAKLGKPCGGSFRSVLADMVRFGVLRRAAQGGYLLA